MKALCITVLTGLLLLTLPQSLKVVDNTTNFQKTAHANLNQSLLPRTTLATFIYKPIPKPPAPKAHTAPLPQPIKPPSVPIVPPSLPAAAPVAPPAPPVYASGCSTYRTTFAQYNWNVSVAMAICQAESSGNPYAVSPTDDHGLMQINRGLELYGSQIYNPAFNISIAYQKYLSQGWGAWTTWSDGAYARYL